MKGMYFFWLVFCFTLYWIYYLYDAFLMNLLVALLLCMATFGLRNMLLQYVRYELLAALFSTIILVLFLIVPVVFVFNSLIALIQGADLAGFNNIIDTLKGRILEWSSDVPEIQTRLKDALSKISGSEIFSYILTVCWIVGITNAINLIDGLDGLSSGVALISCLSLLMVFALNGSPLIAIVLITALAGAIVGFLPFNFNPAKTFIGDTGSNFMGFSLAIISILGVAKTYTALVLIAPIIILGMPIFDTLFAIFRRIIKGKSIKAVFKPDKGHLHHKLMARGYTQKQAVLIMYGITAILGMFAVILLESGVWKALSFALLIIAIVAIGYKDMSRLMNDEDEPSEKITQNHIRKQD